ncbi:hypothetical protein ACVIW0_000944 [Bradyrhizobium sp. USDA 4454]
MLDQHGLSESHYRNLPPDIVVFPETTQEVAEIVKLCASEGLLFDTPLEQRTCPTFEEASKLGAKQWRLVLIKHRDSC